MKRLRPYRSRIKHDPPDYSKLKEHQALSEVMMIRHARSTANDILKKLGSNATVGDYQDLMYEEDSIDCGLSQEGINQCLIASEHAKKVNFQTVWISPLRRTLQTAYHVFGTHPNFEHMRFKVEPLMREKMRVAGDMPSKDVLAMIEREF